MTYHPSFYSAKADARRRAFVALLAVALLFLGLPALAMPPGGGKGGGGGGGGGNGGGGGGGGSTAQPEVRHLWRVQLSGFYSQVRPSVAPDGTIYVVDVLDHLTAVSPDGTVQWVVADAGSKGLDIGPDGTIYTGNENHIKAFNPDGSLKWTFVQNPRAFILIDVAVGPDGNIYAVATSGMGVFSLADTPTGPVLRWTNPEVYSRPIVSYTEIAFGPTQDGGDYQLYFHANKRTKAVRLSDGQTVFEAYAGNTRPRVSPFDGTWHRPGQAFRPDGTPVWSFEFPPFEIGTEPSLAQDGTQYTVSGGDLLFAISPSGVQEYSKQLDEFVGIAQVDPTESYVIVETGGTGTSPGALKGLSASNGSSLWRMEVPLDGSGLTQFVDTDLAYSPDNTVGYYVTATAGTGATSYLDAFSLDPSLPNASTILRSVSVTIDVRSSRKGINLTGIVAVQDQNKAPISGATVFATWRLPDGSTLSQTAVTGGTGEAKFPLSPADGGVFYLDVTDITLEGYTFDPDHSVLTGGQAAF